MGLEQAPAKSEQGTSAPEGNHLREELPATLAGTLDFMPRPTKVADMGAGNGSTPFNDSQYLYFGANIYGQSVRRSDAIQEVADKQTVPGGPLSARETLLQSAESRITDPRQRAQFKADMRAFEVRAQKEGIDPTQVNQTYENINRLLNASAGANRDGTNKAGTNRDGTIAPRDRLTQLAREVMGQAARPTDIAQGQNNTCNVTTVENLLYTKEPGTAAKLVADVAITGGYTAKDGTRITFDKDQIKPDTEARNTTRIDGERSYATQLFNQTAVNLEYQKTNLNVRYEIQPPGGERLMDYSKNPPQQLRDCNGKIQHPNLTDNQIVGAYQSLTGKDGRDIYLAHKSSIDKDSSLLTAFESEKELGDKLAELKAQGKLPIIIAVNSAIEPFYTDGGRGNPRQYDGAHVVVVRDYQPGPPPKVAVDNQYARSADHLGNRMMDLKTLHLAAMETPEAIKYLQREIAEERARGIAQPRRQAELRRLQQFTPAPQCSE